jgi:hypothetical protein
MFGMGLDLYLSSAGQFFVLVVKALSMIESGSRC